MRRKRNQIDFLDSLTSARNKKVQWMTYYKITVSLSANKPEEETVFLAET